MTAFRRSKQWGTGTPGEATGARGTSPTEEITFDLFGVIEDFNDAVTSGDRIEKVNVTALSVNACQELRNDVLEKVTLWLRVTYLKINETKGKPLSLVIKLNHNMTWDMSPIFRLEFYARRV